MLHPPSLASYPPIDDNATMAKRKATAKKKDKKGGGSDGGGEPAGKKGKKDGGNIIDTKAITSLATQIISAYQSNDYKLLDRCDDDGTIERVLWPWFLRCAVSSEGVAADDLAGGEDAAFALAILSNRRGGGGGGTSSSNDRGGGGGGVGGSDGQLSFLVDDDYYGYSQLDQAEEKDDVAAVVPPRQRSMAFATLLKLLLSYQERHAGSGDDDNKLQSIAIQTEVLKFLIASYSSMELRCKSNTSDATTATTSPSSEQRICEGPLTDLVGIRLWDAIPSRKRHLEMKRDGLLRKRYGLFDAKRKGGDGAKNVGFLPGIVVRGLLDSVDILCREDGVVDMEDNQQTTGKNLLRGYISKVLELLLDLLSYPQTRTHVAPYLSSHHVVVRLALSKLYRQKKDNKFVLFRQQVDMLLDSERMDTSSSSTQSTTMEYGSGDSPLFHERAHTLQKLLHRHHVTECNEVVFAGVGRVTDGRWLKEKIGLWKEETLYDVCYRLRLVDDDDDDASSASTTTRKAAESLGVTRRDLLSSILLYHITTRKSDAEILSTTPLYPTESLLWDGNSVPPGNFSLASDTSSSSLSLPKLNTRFLSAGDYLLRNFRLFRLESAYDIRGDIVDVVKRMRPTLTRDLYSQQGDYSMDYYGGDEMNDDDGTGTEFQGWARMGLELGSKKHDKPGMRLLRVDPPKLGENIPSSVIAEVVLDLHHCATSLAKEWDELGEFDNLFLVSVDATRMSGEAAPLIDGNEEGRHIPDEEDCTFPRRYGIRAVRGCMVLDVRDEAGTVLSDPALAYQDAVTTKEEGGGKPGPRGKLRYLRVALDPAQYALDATRMGGLDLYDKFNLVVRRHGRENNFKAVLETIRGLIRGGSEGVYRSIPSWLLPILLGCGAARGGSTVAPSSAAALDYGDTFVDVGHLRDSFPGCELIVDGRKVTTAADAGPRKKYRVSVTAGGPNQKVKVTATSYPFSSSHLGNTIRFTPVQVSAVRSALTTGLTTIIGPPGTGKTDVAVQIIANLYHSFPSQRTVVVTHSNAALNDIFDKVVARGDVNERYVLRLGSGEKHLQTTSSSSHDFTKGGRVAHILSRRRDLLEKVQRLSESFGVSGKGERSPDGSPSYTCETAGYFHSRYVKGKVDGFDSDVKERKVEEDGGANVIDIFPFTKYFSTLSEGGGGSTGDTTLSLEEAHAKISTIESIFTELAEYRPIELLRTQRQRTDYLLTKQVKIVAMTCTHASIARSQLVSLGFHYDNVVVEEAGQMLDVETFIPLLLQRGTSDDSSDGHNSRLKRIVLIGDHNQLPPVVKNRSFATYSHYDQSLFARLVRLGSVPSIELNKQGRARPDIARLYSWRYDDLGDLERVTKGNFLRANAGLAHTFQLINVDEFEGRGESTPTAYFYQNVGEAEYAIALFQYMVLMGYPPDKISILTTYNGQKSLLVDILSQRCGEGTPLAGIEPGAISTVDQYQGQQNDYIILSLVRTRAVGHLRDVRRLVVAVSRARLGLYVLCRSSVFCNCHELRRTMDQFAARPTKLQLVKGEHYPTERLVEGGDGVPESLEVADVTELGALVHSMQQELGTEGRGD